MHCSYTQSWTLQLSSIRYTEHTECTSRNWNTFIGFRCTHLRACWISIQNRWNIFLYFFTCSLICSNSKTPIAWNYLHRRQMRTRKWTTQHINHFKFRPLLFIYSLLKCRNTVISVSSLNQTCNVCLHLRRGVVGLMASGGQVHRFQEKHIFFRLKLSRKKMSICMIDFYVGFHLIVFFVWFVIAEFEQVMKCNKGEELKP